MQRTEYGGRPKAKGQGKEKERHGPAGTLVPTRANGIRERLGVSGWRFVDAATGTLSTPYSVCVR